MEWLPHIHLPAQHYKTKKEHKPCVGRNPVLICARSTPAPFALHTLKASSFGLMVTIPPKQRGGQRLLRQENIMYGRQSRQPSHVTLGDYLCGMLGMTVRGESSCSIRVPSISAYTLDGTRAAIGKYVQVGQVVAPATPIIKNYRIPEEYLEVRAH